MERNASWEQYNLKNVDLWFEVIRYEGRMINFELEVKNWVRMINFELKTEFEWLTSTWRLKTEFEWLTLS